MQCRSEAMPSASLLHSQVRHASCNRRYKSRRRRPEQPQSLSRRLPFSLHPSHIAYEPLFPSNCTDHPMLQAKFIDRLHGRVSKAIRLQNVFQSSSRTFYSRGHHVTSTPSSLPGINFLPTLCRHGILKVPERAWPASVDMQATVSSSTRHLTSRLTANHTAPRILSSASGLSCFKEHRKFVQRHRLSSFLCSACLATTRCTCSCKASIKVANHSWISDATLHSFDACIPCASRG